MKRFYTEVSTGSSDGASTVLLDGRPVRTPARSLLAVPTEPLAQAIAAEWAAQPQHIESSGMRLTRLATTVVDLTPVGRGDAVDQVTGYAGTDLLCYRAASPATLVARQATSWQPWLDWAEQKFDAQLRTAVGVMPISQDEAALRALRGAIARLDDWRLIGLHGATLATGSLVLGLAIERGALAADRAFAMALLDELFEIEQWGEDAEQSARHARLRADLRAVQQFLELVA